MAAKKEFYYIIKGAGNFEDSFMAENLEAAKKHLKKVYNEELQSRFATVRIVDYSIGKSYSFSYSDYSKW